MVERLERQVGDALLAAAALKGGGRYDVDLPNWPAELERFESALNSAPIEMAESPRKALLRELRVV